MLTSTYVALMFALFAYKSDLDSLLGMQSMSAYIFAAVFVAVLLPNVSISLYTNDKNIYLSDASAHLYRPSAYYMAKVCVRLEAAWRCNNGVFAQDGVPVKKMAPCWLRMATQLCGLSVVLATVASTATESLMDRFSD